MKRLLIAEKPALARDVVAAIPEELSHIADDLDVLCVFPFTAFPPNIPRHLPFSQLPFIREPAYQINQEAFRFNGGQLFDFFKVATEDQESESFKVDFLKHFFSQYDEIYFFMDPDYSGQFAINQLMQACGLPLLAKNHYHGQFRTLARPDLTNTWRNLFSGTTDDSRILSMTAEGRVKRYFDYLWAINSASMSSVLMKDLGTENFILSKYHLLTLILMEEGTTFSGSSLIMAMTEHTGTGKYADNEIGSPASKCLIIEQLCHAGLIDSSRMYDRIQLQLSFTGRQLLERLHKKFKDRDLPGRLHFWQHQVRAREQTEMQIKATIDRYIRTLFGKQKNFMNRQKQP